MKNGPMALALGFEYREEEMNDRPPPCCSPATSSAAAAPPATNASRDVTAFFGELNIPILKNLEAQIARALRRLQRFRQHHQPEGRAALDADQVDPGARLTTATGFRAPTLSDLFLPRFLSNTADVHNDPIRCPGSTPIGAFVNEGLECDAQFQNQLGGNTALQPEESRQWTAGVLLGADARHLAGRGLLLDPPQGLDRRAG